MQNDREKCKRIKMNDFCKTEINQKIFILQETRVYTIR